MKKTIVTAFLSTAAFYLSVAVTGYAALGSSAPGDVLTGFDVSPEVELIANAAVMMHMVAAVQVFMQPLYEVRLKCTVAHMVVRWQYRCSSRRCTRDRPTIPQK